MKLILSRKGFDSSSGGCPSPIFPDGTMFSLPIPVASDKITYGELRHYSERLGEVDIGEVVTDLTCRRYPDNQIGAGHSAHLDPDINFHAYPRQEGWRGLFGQAGGTETHLVNEEVKEDDLFLFFGLFREVEEQDGCWRFVPSAKPRHILWGWLHIGELYEQVGETGIPELAWASHHPHLQYGGEKNTIYVASEKLKIGNRFAAPGAGVFPKLHERLTLTEPGRSSSYWRFPGFFYPDGKTPMSWQGGTKNWKRGSGYAYLQSVGRGQEFVLNLDEYPEVKGWARDLIRDLGQR